MLINPESPSPFESLDYNISNTEIKIGETTFWLVTMTNKFSTNESTYLLLPESLRPTPHRKYLTTLRDITEIIEILQNANATGIFPRSYKELEILLTESGINHNTISRRIAFF
ncbi:hypothetical protein KBC89_03240 [Candidatus Woesebacteria bacterium]|nr:hypothetical protein [Candidatus Woesebacteria bacterium]